MDDDPAGPLATRTSAVRLEATFASFCSAELRAVVAFLMRFGATFPEAQDAAQIAMIEAWRNWGSLTEPGNYPRAWVRKVAHRAFLRSMPKWEVLGYDAIDDLPAVTDIELSECTQIMFDLLGRLPYRQRAVLAYTADGFDDKWIAAELKSTPAAVRKNRQRARETMKELLQGGDT